MRNLLRGISNFPIFFLGIQQSPAVGRAVAEMIVNSEFRTIDLTRLGFDRLVVNEKMLEQNIV